MLLLDRGKVLVPACRASRNRSDFGTRAIASALHFVVAQRGAGVIHEELRIDGAVHVSLSHIVTRHS
ncbi:hypothetical protein ATY78_26215 [Rhizobium sp. R635]|nr:hypothetical protein ATY78_26215 [Rhizobium sp. R635]